MYAQHECTQKNHKQNERKAYFSTKAGKRMYDAEQEGIERRRQPGGRASILTAEGLRTGVNTEGG